MTRQMKLRSRRRATTAVLADCRHAPHSSRSCSQLYRDALCIPTTHPPRYSGRKNVGQSNKRTKAQSNVTSNDFERIKREAEDRSSWQKRLSQTCRLVAAWSRCDVVLNDTPHSVVLGQAMMILYAQLVACTSMKEIYVLLVYRF